VRVSLGDGVPAEGHKAVGPNRSQLRCGVNDEDERTQMTHTAIPRTAQEERNDAASVEEGLVVLNQSLGLMALDHGARTIMEDLEGSTRHDDRDVGLPLKLACPLNARSRDQLNGAYFCVKGSVNKYSCRAFVANPQAANGSDSLLILYLKRAHSLVDAIHEIGTDYHLTFREQEVLIGVSMGLTSKELATRMDISPNTVKAFLRLIMIKMGVTTRSGIVGKLLDQNERKSAGANESRSGFAATAY